MKLYCEEFDFQISMEENQINVLSVENPKAYSMILEDLWNQCNGGDGMFVLSEKDITKSITKELNCVFHPFDFSVNSKRVITKLYQELRENAEEQYLEDCLEVHRNIIQLLDRLALSVDYPVKYDFELDVSTLLKLYDVQMDCDGLSLLERMIDYVKIMHRLCHVTIFLWIGLKQYLDVEELKQFYEFVFYEKINLIIVEAFHSPKIESEKCFLLDQDLCIIEL